VKRRAVAVIGVMAGLVVISVLGVGFSSATFHAQSANPTNTFTAATPFCAGTTTQTVTADRDTYVDQNSPNSTAGGSTSLVVNSKSNKNERVLVGFTLPSKPVGCSVTSATLKLTATSSDSGRTLQAFQVGPAETWTEAGATWNNQPASTGTAATTTSGSGLRQWTVTSQVQAMYGSSNPNNGFLVRDQTESANATQTFSSREASTNKPQLSITFG